MTDSLIFIIACNNFIIGHIACAGHTINYGSIFDKTIIMNCAYHHMNFIFNHIHVHSKNNFIDTCAQYYLKKALL